MGDDIASACGQLVLDTKKKENCGGGDGGGDVEDLAAAGKGGCGGGGEEGGAAVAKKSVGARVVVNKKQSNGGVAGKSGDDNVHGASASDLDIKVEMGKLGENIPGVLVQYSILGLVCWGVYRWVSRVF